MDELSKSWIRVGSIGGILSIVSYFAAAFIPLPDLFVYTLAFAFGPLLAVGSIGLYHSLAARRRSPLVQIATLFAATGSFILLAMISVQQAIFSTLKNIAEKPGEAGEIRALSAGLNAVQLGLDVAWDVLISTAVVLFGFAMLKHPAFGKIAGGLGILSGSLLLAFNLWHFPTPPVSAGSIDWGPAVALWLAGVFILNLRSARTG